MSQVNRNALHMDNHVVNATRKINSQQYVTVPNRNRTPSRGNPRNQRVNCMYDDQDSEDEYYETIKTVTIKRPFKTCILDDEDETVRPVLHPPRKIPVALREKPKTELEWLTDKEMITRVTEPTPWGNNLVIVEKPNKLRICLDPCDLNKAKRSHYPMPTI
ncbi:unnamed protein product [Mytilus coruscus]|uniref:Reverse transcriptase domain-containing protein n=1 Tax=Mytilus coruscus TaxID=42192 RepID=A0A6J8AEA9_MYTCO|nr:unnamed protein product [Mytilus coruscus]